MRRGPDSSAPDAPALDRELPLRGPVDSDSIGPKGRELVEATLGTARRTVALALCAMALLLTLVALERAWSLRTHDDATDRVVQAERIAGSLLLGDERLTMSAYMAAATGEERWIARYHKYLPDIEAKLTAGQALAPTEVARHFNEQTQAATQRLIERETSALEAIAVGAPAVARSILDSSDYQRDKALLTGSTIEFADSTLQAMRDELKASRRRADLMLIATLALAVAAGALTWRRLHASLARSRDALVDSQRQIERLATRDALTGWPNRAALHQGMREALARARRDGRSMALLMIDLDRFKPINDSHGHQIGDAVLREAAHRMGELLRDGELHARYGGDEFVALIGEGDDAAIAHRVAERLIAALGEPIEVGAHRLQIGASVGIARYPHDAQDADDWLRRADLALYRAKGGGRARVCFYDAAIDSALAERETMELRLREAIENGRIVAHYQPVVDLADRHVRSVELLARWQDPERGLVPPAEFIPVAERSGLIGPLTLALLRRACGDLARMPAGWRVAINVAPCQFHDPLLATRLIDEMRAAGADPRRFEIELTETALMADFDVARRTLETLKRHGVTIALDDFGTGYSSLSTLSQLSFDKIKIDRGFVATLHERNESAKIVQSIIGLGASLGVQVVAEGVETERDARALVRLGCGAAQGFLFSRPLPIEALLLGQHGAPVALSA